MPSVEFYEHGKGRGNFMLVMNKIEAKRQWAIVHDLEEDRWEVWVDGQNVDTVYTQGEAQKSMQRFLSGESKPWGR